MSWYTPEQRRRGIATRKRNARLRREEIARLGYNPYNPTVKLKENLLVTKNVEKKLTEKAESKTPFPLVGGIIISILWIIGLALVFADGQQSAWRFIFLLPAFLASLYFGLKHERKVKSNTVLLAEERKKRLEETRQFYSSPEWQQVRNKVIKERGRVCSECGLTYEDSYEITVDHIRPRSKYPELALEPSNLRVLCRSCNSRKGVKDSEIYYR